MAKITAPILFLGKKNKYPVIDNFLSEETELLDFVQTVWIILGFFMFNALFLASWDHTQLIKFRVFTFVLTTVSTAIVSTFPALIIVSPLAKGLYRIVFDKKGK
ncbi:uncharacterized protein LOC113468790 [Diaphorina citri]|uniref:Uncharacterized protein LOC113468790 n=1 Tax=Diaphorina citri TaxID=121845 RepID=A0A3Q0J4E4_DIACI|nr:uncharacterized protein LOC113468790 [Diaphorina citri]